MPLADKPGDLGRFLTPADIAEILNVSLEHALTLVSSGDLPAIRLGGAGWRIEREVLEQFIAGQYEEARLMAQWNESQNATVHEFSAGPRGQRP
ncbi:MAG: helix-turn-helix domain-containing protein [Microbacteriaceae bacterium]|jgi:excisionase family DNA binding protein